MSRKFASLKVSPRKLDELAHECFQNALRLHFDSILLTRAGSYASAFAISVIASEEFGKGFGIEEITFQGRMNRGFDEEHKKHLGLLLSDHKVKQAWFVSSLFGVMGPRTILKRYQSIQVDKNNAIYTGVRKGNHHIVRPFLVSSSRAKRQVRLVNDCLIEYSEIRLRDSEYDDEISDQVFRRRRLLQRLKLAAKSLR
jgi:AbiV family abortive infection protein